MSQEIQYRIVESRKSGTNQVAYTHAQIESEFVEIGTRGAPYTRRRGDLACRPKYKAPKLHNSFCSTITCKACKRRLAGREARLVK